MNPSTILDSDIWRSKKLWIPLAAIAVVVIGLLAVPALIDATGYRGPIVSQLEQRLGRSVTLGALSWRLLPSVEIRADDVAIGDDPQFGGGAFIKARSVRLAVGLWSLLSGRPEVNGIELTEPEVALIKGKNAAWNWSTLKAVQAAEPRAELAPIDIVIRQGRFTLIDRAPSPAVERTYTGVDVEIESFSWREAADFTLAITLPGPQAGRLHLAGRAGPLDLKDFARTPLEARVRMRQVELASLEAWLGQSSARAGRLTLEASVEGTLAESLEAEGEIKAEQLKLAADATPAGTPLAADFKLRAGAQTDAKAPPERDYAVQIEKADLKLGQTSVRVSGHIAHLLTRPDLDLQLKGDAVALEGLLESAHAFGFGPSPGTRASGTAKLDLRATGPVDALALTGQSSLSNARIQAAPLQRPIEISGADLNFTGDGLRIENLRAQLAESQIAGWLQIKNFDHPAASFDLQLNQLILAELNKLVATNDAASRQVSAESAFSLIPMALAETKSPASASTWIPAEGEIAIGRVVAEKFTASDLKGHAVLKERTIRLSQLAFAFCGGLFQGQLWVELAEGAPGVAVDGRFSRVDVNQFLSAVTSGKSVVYGRASGSLNVRGRQLDKRDGPLLSARSLTGPGRLVITDGHIASFDLARQVELIGKLTGLPTGDGRTEFRALSTDLRFDGDRLFTDNLRLEMNQMTVTGRGVLTLGEPVMTDHRLLAQLSSSLTRRLTKDEQVLAAMGAATFGDLGVPLKMSGPLTQPSFQPDAEALARRTAERFIKQPDQTVKGILDLFRRGDQTSPKKQRPRP